MTTWRKNFVDYRKVAKVDLDGHRFDSKLEACLYLYLKAEVDQGRLELLRCKEHVFLTAARIEMIPDFCAFDCTLQQEVYYEAKGFETDVWFIKKKLWHYYGPARLRIFKGNAQRFRMVEEIIPKG